MAGGDVFEFARTARPGETLEYARGAHPPRELVRAMRPLVEAGVLSPVARRSADGFRFIVERGTAPIARAKAPRRGTVRRRRVRKSSLTQVFEMLARAARRGEPCPTNDELARACGLSGKLAASYRVRRLAAMGHVTVEDHSPFGRRVITILTGRDAGARTCEAAL